ncbi:GntR family transcriptional regulator [Kitasatospora aureofaciens]|uniref:GntR family transcriptional regulator n=1 Tax=Kitasatospora aureofaciens TaxID=1894 RepID=UPI0037FE7320
MAKRYEQIAAKLKAQIDDGSLPPGERLPAETELADIYEVSVPTVRQAVGVLQAQGLVDKQHGRGTFVRRQPTPVTRDNLRHQWEKNRARAPESERVKTGATEHDTGLTVNDLVFASKYEKTPANADLAAAFGIPEGTMLLERTYRTRRSGERAPFDTSRSYLVLDMIEGNPDLLRDDQEPWPGGTQNQLFTVGIELDRIVETFRARPPTPEETEELGLPVGVSVIILRKTCIDTTDRVVEVADVVLPGDRTEMVYTTQLSRW